jgi:hypothetical protein
VSLRRIYYLYPNHFIVSYEELEVESWAFEALEDPEVVSIDALTGVFALSDIEMSTGHYWLTFGMKPVSNISYLAITSLIFFLERARGLPGLRLLVCCLSCAYH